MAINLQKGQRISLIKEAGGSLSKIVMGLGWDCSDGNDIDLDASCVMFDDDRQPLGAVYFGQLESSDGSILHTGDNLTGEGDGDDEQIIVDLTKVAPEVKSLVFLVSSFTGDTFDEIENAFCRVVNGTNGQELARFDLSCSGEHTAMVMAKIYLHNGEWKMHAIGVYAEGRTFDDLMPEILAAL
jgi:tellurium resistance protein TerZ